MQKKLTALLLSLLFPALYLLITLTVQAAASALVVSRVRSGMPGLEDDWIINQANLELRSIQPWLLIVSAMLTLLLAAALLRWQGTAIKLFIGPRRLRLPALLTLSEIGMGLNLALYALVALLPLPEAWFTEYASGVKDPLGAAGPMAKLLCTVIAAPLVEEAVFRGFCYRFLKRGFSPRMALLWQAVLFAVFHWDKLQMFYVVPAAIVLGLAYDYCGTLLAPIALHMVFNAFSNLNIPLPNNIPGLAVFFVIGTGITALGFVSLSRQKTASNQ